MEQQHTFLFLIFTVPNHLSLASSPLGALRAVPRRRTRALSPLYQITRDGVLRFERRVFQLGLTGRGGQPAVAQSWYVKCGCAGSG